MNALVDDALTHFQLEEADEGAVPPRSVTYSSVGFMDRRRDRRLRQPPAAA
jgi:hypothetical protein